MPRILLLLAAQAILPSGADGQSSRHIRTPDQVADSVAVAALAHTLTSSARTERDRAAALYEWVARHITYDIDAYLSEVESHETAEAVYRYRRALCGGYVSLYIRLAREAGLEAEAVAGYAKGFDYVFGQSTRRQNHSWVVVRVEGGWALVDPTWGAGAVSHGRFAPAFTWSWFMVPPEVLVLSHMPREAAWQLLPRPMPRSEFERLPAVPRALLEVGFQPSDIRRAAVVGRVRDFPLVAPQDASVQVVRAPIAGTLSTDATVDVEVIWPGAVDVAVVSGGVWTHFARAGDRFHGRAAAAADRIWVV
ncbi:MAG TPA: transglutaminase domain-containing protein, partial [Longimicrobiales bacterium]|nr:transglutaminase domain-containing protein [Longimicrobiales bacterium]